MDKSGLYEFLIILCIFPSITLLLYILYKYWLLCKKYDEFPCYKGISWIKYCFWIGSQGKSDSLPSLAYLFQFLNGLAKIYYEDGIYLMWILFRPAIFVFKAELIQDLISNPAVEDKPAEYETFNPILGSGLVNRNGESWSNHRKLINPSFQLLKLREYVAVFNKNAIILKDKFESLLEEPWINPSEHITSCAFDIIWESTMGVFMGSQEGNEDAKEYIKCIDVGKEIVVHRFFRPWTQVNALFGLTPLGIKEKIASKRSHSIIRKIINEKIALLENKCSAKETLLNGYRKKSFLETLLFKTGSHDFQFTAFDLENEVSTIMTAGFDTVSFTLQWALLLLGLHPDVQEDAARELNDISEDSSHLFTYEDLHNMKYLECVIKETLRLYSTVPIIAREVKEDVQAGKYTIPKGTLLIFHFYMLHRDPEIYPEPEKFKPERFFPENNINRHPFSYMPFSAGARNCIGQKYGMMEMKVILAHIIRNFRIQALDHRDKIRPSWEISMRNLDEVRIHLSRRFVSCEH